MRFPVNVGIKLALFSLLFLVHNEKHNMMNALNMNLSLSLSNVHVQVHSFFVNPESEFS